MVDWVSFVVRGGAGSRRRQDDGATCSTTAVMLYNNYETALELRHSKTREGESPLWREVEERMNKGKSLGMVGLVVFTLFALSLTAEAQSQKEGAPLSEKAQKGKALFNDRCFVCHDVDSARVRPLGPTLDGLFKRDKLVVGKPVTDENVKEVIKTGPTPGMPGFRYTLSDQEIDDLVAYLKVK